MSSSVIGALRVNLGLDSAQFERGTGKAQKSLRNMRNQFAAVAGAAAAMGVAITAMAIKGGNDIDRVVKGARRIDGTAGSFQALELAASEAGVSLSGLTNDIQTMNRELSSGSSGAIKALDRLGMSADDLLSMDADERVATIADRVKELGLTAGQATDLLRDLGIRNREMALLMIQGGAAIRDARDDIRSYGLEIDDALGAKIEEANDRIARLGIVSQYLGQRLAAELVPAMGAFANSITEAMREGGALRGVIDGLVDNLQLMVSVTAVAVAALGVRYVGALVLAKLSTITLTGALVALRTALLRTGIGALIVGAGMLVDQLAQLRIATGSWGETLSALGTVSQEVWERMGHGLESVRRSALAVSAGFQSAFLSAFAGIIRGFSTLTTGLAEGWNTLMRSIGQDAKATAQGIGADLADSIQLAADLEGQTSRLQSQAAGVFRNAATAPLESIQALRDIISQTADGTTIAADAARALREELDGIAGSGGGGRGGAPAAAQELQNLTDTAVGASSAGQELGQGFASAFTDALMGVRSLNDALKDLLSNMAKMFLNQAFSQIFDGLFPSFSFGGARAAGGPVASGRTYLVGERGPELFTPSGGGHIVPNHALGGGGTNVQIINNTGAPVREDRQRGPDGRELVRVIVGEELARGGFDKQMNRFGVGPTRVRR